MQSRSGSLASKAAALLCVLLLAGFDSGPRPGQVLDEARAAGRDAASFPAAGEDYFHDMDGGVALTPDEIKGRNTWLLWTGGNDRFWDGMTASTFGAFDLLKIVAYDPTRKADRDWRWSCLGLINEPCFEAPSAPDPGRFGLMLDTRRPTVRPTPFADESKYPGVKIGARGTDASRWAPIMVIPTGIVGLRLFPNPDFDEAAAQRWDPERYFTDPSYYNDKNLVRPYRVGMSCGFCHVGPSPTNPPAEPGAPGMGQSEFDRRRSVHVGRSAVRVQRRPEELHVSARAHLPAGRDGHLAGLDRLHQQSADDERGLRSRRAARYRAALGTGDAERRRAEKQAVQRFCLRRSADAVLRPAEYRRGRRAS